jgi:hypothetical protein
VTWGLVQEGLLFDNRRTRLLSHRQTSRAFQHGHGILLPE